MTDRDTEAFLGSSADVTGKGHSSVQAYTGDFNVSYAADAVDPNAGTEDEGRAQVSGFTFDPTTAVNTTTDVITLGSAHGYRTGDALVYSDGMDTQGIDIASSDPDRLEEGQTYYVIADDTDSTLSGTQLKLAETEEDALEGVAIDLTSTSGLSHTHELSDGTPMVPFMELSAPGNQLDSSANTDFNDDGTADMTEDSTRMNQDRSATATMTAVRGVAVTAINKVDVETIGVSGGGAGLVAVNVGGEASALLVDTKAYVAEGAQVNTNTLDSPHSDQSVLVAAGSDTSLLGVAAAVSVAGKVSVSPGVDVAVIDSDTRAFIDDTAVVEAERDVQVVAVTKTDSLTVAAGVAGAGLVGVGVAAGVAVVTTNTEAWIGDDTTDTMGATVRAGGNVLVSADDSTQTLEISGSLGLGFGAVGVGAGASITVVNKTTEAYIGHHSTVDAKGNSGTLSGILDGSNTSTGFGTEASGETDVESGDAEFDFRGVAVQATSSEDIYQAGASAGGGLFAGVAGGVTVEVVDSDTTAYIGASTLINSNNGGTQHTDQSVNVTAANDLQVFTFAGAVGIGIAGVAGGVDVGVVRNDTIAYIGNSANVRAARDVDVNSLTRQELDNIAVSVGGGGAAISNSLVVWSLGSDNEFDSTYSYEEENVDDGTTTTQSETPINRNDVAMTLSTQDQANNGQEGNAGAAFATNLEGYSTTDENGAEDDTPDNTHLMGTNMAAAGATLRANSSDTLLTDALAGEEVGGTSAYIGNNATITVGGDVNVRADGRLDVFTIVGAVSLGATAVGGSMAIIVNDAHTESFIADGVTINAGTGADDDVRVRAGYHDDWEGFAVAGS
ncbi:MAG: hypothetical protein MI725_09985, partial [Pirellulales bacterium]|nr:hypothetical protein [Pirellulales bacterium]